jgi:hypothetical protein
VHVSVCYSSRAVLDSENTGVAGSKSTALRMSAIVYVSFSCIAKRSRDIPNTLPNSSTKCKKRFILSEIFLKRNRLPSPLFDVYKDFNSYFSTMLLYYFKRPIQCKRTKWIFKNNKLAYCRNMWHKWESQDSSVGIATAGVRELFPRGKAVGAWTWPLTSTPRYVFMACLIKHRDDFSFILCRRCIK